MPTLYVIDINIYSVFATPVKGRFQQVRGNGPPGPVLRDPGKQSKALDFPRSLHSLPLEFIPGILHCFANIQPFLGDLFI